MKLWKVAARHLGEFLRLFKRQRLLSEARAAANFREEAPRETEGLQQVNTNMGRTSSDSSSSSACPNMQLQHSN